MNNNLILYDENHYKNENLYEMCSKCKKIYDAKFISMLAIDKLIYGLCEGMRVYTCIECEEKICERLEECIKELKECIPRKKRYINKHNTSL